MKIYGLEKYIATSSGFIRFHKILILTFIHFRPVQDIFNNSRVIREARNFGVVIKFSV